MHLPRPHLSGAAKSEPCALPPRKLTSTDKYATLFPLFLPLSASFPGWAWFHGPSQTFWKTSAVAQSRQEYLFLVSICIASSLGEELGGEEGGGDVPSPCQPKRRPGTPSSPPAPAPAAVAARDLGRQAPFELLKDQPSWKSQLATIRPFPLTARCAFVWAARLEDSPSLWVAWRCSFRRPRRGAKQVSRASSQQVKIFALLLSRCYQMVLSRIHLLAQAFIHLVCVYPTPVCCGSCQCQRPSSEWGWRVLCPLGASTEDRRQRERRESYWGWGHGCTDHRLETERRGGGVPPAAMVLDSLSEEEMEGPDVKGPGMGKESRCFWTEQQLPWPPGRKAEETFSQGTLKGASRGFRIE